MTLSGWRVWAFVASSLCLAAGGALLLVDDFLDVHVAGELVALLFALGLPSLVVEIRAWLRSGELVLERRRR